uniref:CD9 molecule n=1 Tax=Pseudonaja textilis TaxID=8673 RepID=A0A670XPL0_PSETE
MPVKGGTKCIKYLLFGFNFIFWLAGTAVLGIGLWLRFDSQNKDIFESNESTSNFYTGKNHQEPLSNRVANRLLGCLNPTRGCSCFLRLIGRMESFFTFLLVIFALEVAAAIWGFSNKEKVGETYTVFILQKFCSVSSWFGVWVWGATVQTDDNNQPMEQKLPSEVVGVPSPCPVAIDDFFKNKLNLIAAVGIGVAVVMIFGMIFSMILCCAIRRDREMV